MMAILTPTLFSMCVVGIMDVDNCDEYESCIYDGLSSESWNFYT